eukprot:3771050-Pyramimonas_sp.AAC.1
MATLSQIAAPHGRRGLAQVCEVPHSVGPTSSPQKWRQFHRSQLPMDGEVSPRSARCLTLLDPPAALESGGNFADRSPPQ